MRKSAGQPPLGKYMRSHFGLLYCFQPMLILFPGARRLFPKLKKPVEDSKMLLNYFFNFGIKRTAIIAFINFPPGIGIPSPVGVPVSPCRPGSTLIT